MGDSGRGASAEIRIEPISEATIPGANAIHNDFLGAGKAMCFVCPYSWCPETDRDFAARFHGKYRESLETTAVAVREADGAVLGVIQTSVHGQARHPSDRDMHKMRPGECYIEWLAVSASARGMGLGTRLLQWADALAVARGCNMITLGVVNGNPARRLYERQGFVAVDRSPSICDTCCLALVLGCPNGQLGGVDMEKVLGELA